LLLEIFYAGKLKKKEELSHLIKLLKRKTVIEAESMICKGPLHEKKLLDHKAHGSLKN